MQDITIATPFVRQTLLGAQDAGYDITRILNRCGIPPSLVAQDRGRVPLRSFVALIQHLMRLLDDECLGLLNRRQAPGSFEMLARSVLHERELGPAMVCYARCATTLNPELINSVDSAGAQTLYCIRRRDELRARSVYIFESAVMTAHRFFCWLTRQRIPLERVELDYPAPPWADEYRFIFYGAPVVFDQPQIKLVMRSADIDLAVRQNLANLNDYLRRAPRDMFTPIRSATVTQQAREHVLSSLANAAGLPRQAQTAEALGLHPQTFWRRLRAEGTDFTAIRTQARRDSAITLLSESALSIERIAEQLDFSESSAFIRAFKQWTGLTPLAYRRA